MSFHLAAKDVSWAALTAFSLRRLFRPLPSAIRPLIAKRHAKEEKIGPFIIAFRSIF
ncbi:unnamed protein product [Larinioides sclopetarius]|uniref:Uncharacterized protein n=1 Tax=Larinioides sclopetarius TaxID=280406 RepID=A0AAV1ZJU0_9ARAC